MWPIIVAVAALFLIAGRSKASSSSSGSGGTAPPSNGGASAPSRTACYGVIADYLIAHPDVFLGLPMDQTPAHLSLRTCINEPAIGNDISKRTPGFQTAVLQDCRGQLIFSLQSSIEGDAMTAVGIEHTLRQHGAVAQADCVKAIRTGKTSDP